MFSEFIVKTLELFLTENFRPVAYLVFGTEMALATLLALSGSSSGGGAAAFVVFGAYAGYCAWRLHVVVDRHGPKFELGRWTFRGPYEDAGSLKEKGGVVLAHCGGENFFRLLEIVDAESCRRYAQERTEAWAKGCPGVVVYSAFYTTDAAYRANMLRELQHFVEPPTEAHPAIQSDDARPAQMQETPANVKKCITEADLESRRGAPKQ